MRLLSALLIAPVWLAAQSAPSAPADTTGKKSDPPAPVVNHLETTLAGFKLTGFAAGSYSYSGRSVGDSAIVGRLYDRLQNRFMLNALALVLDKPYDPTKFSAGFRSEEHTSELQSRLHLVCRLLLEKKKKKAEKYDTILVKIVCTRTQRDYR